MWLHCYQCSIIECVWSKHNMKSYKTGLYKWGNDQTCLKQQSTCCFMEHCTSTLPGHCKRIFFCPEKSKVHLIFNLLSRFNLTCLNTKQEESRSEWQAFIHSFLNSKSNSYDTTFKTKGFNSIQKHFSRSYIHIKNRKLSIRWSPVMVFVVDPKRRYSIVDF